MVKAMKKKNVRRSFKKRKPTIKKLAKKVNKLYRQIETKHFRVSGIGANPTNDPTLAIRPYLFGTGTSDFGTRVGDKITAKWLTFKSTWNLNAGASGTVGRIICFVMKQNPDGIAVSFATIYNLLMESAFSNSTNIVNANKDWDNRSNFSILYDKKIVINPTIVDKVTTKVWDFNVTIPQSLQNVQYFSGSGSSISKNELFIALISEVDSQFAVNYNAEVYYTDS